VGLKMARYDFSTAVGLFKSIIGFIMVWLANRFASKYDMGMF
jgi:putative aldouronate transport system permease protein